MKRVDKIGGIVQTTVFQKHEEKLYVHRNSEEHEKEIYSKNARARAYGQTGKGSVRLHLQMSEQDYTELCLKYPVLHHGNSRQRRKAWLQIAKKRPELVAMPFEKRFHPTGVK